MALQFVSKVINMMPSFFISHGGPPTLFDTVSGAYKQWQAIGQDIQALQPQGIVVVSAHWEGQEHSSAVEINEALETPLIYDFYGFPAHYYVQQFPHRSAPWLVSAVKDRLTSAGIDYVGIQGKGRGLDHGAWVPFKVMFPNHTKESFPILQISLPGDGSLVSSYKLGKALDGLREQGVIIIASGQPVHNLRDYFTGKNDTYGPPFIRSVGNLVRAFRPSNALEKIEEIQRDPNYKKAVPEPDHFMPLFVALGSVREHSEREEEGAAKVVWEMSQGSLGWGFYRVD
ncbi:Extradiol ring-cleavage dioxygenase, class III enzyme, subunit B [Phaffia rhodozyma]|uniref:Extradiol ring-cleavage dioxygenase, class III enzyme, subunit B n=1 Tax=Phaffia rhodozyma TaxID=264483 RepID=A0A0F7SRK1_PHARH|nr:Extradiol ring-cleavage dioxygenase, class III enzyme, subunit B [Phaffia rhodozyma]